VLHLTLFEYFFIIFYLQHAPLQIVILHAWNNHRKHCVYFFIVLTCYVVIDILVYVWFYMF
jgi:hypothetical protein